MELILDETKLKDSNFWKGRVLVFLTGASRGLGKAIATSIAGRFLQRADRTDRKLSFVLHARSLKALERCTAELLQLNLDPDGPVQILDPVVGDLADRETVESFKKSFQHNITAESSSSIWDQVLLILNAGSIGDPDRLVSQLVSIKSSDEFNSDCTAISHHFESNLTANVMLTSIFMSLTGGENLQSTERIVISITSLAALQPLKGMSLYCAGKAAMDAFLRSLACDHDEEVQAGRLTVFSYAPGPLATDMTATLDVRGHMRDFFATKSNLLTAEQSAQRLVLLLESRAAATIQSCAPHIDYHDIKIK